LLFCLLRRDDGKEFFSFLDIFAQLVARDEGGSTGLRSVIKGDRETMKIVLGTLSGEGDLVLAPVYLRVNIIEPGFA